MLFVILSLGFHGVGGYFRPNLYPCAGRSGRNPLPRQQARCKSPNKRKIKIRKKSEMKKQTKANSIKNAV